MSIATPPKVTHWTVGQLDDLTGRTYLITGANSGIGYHAAAHLRRAGGDVIVAARSPEKGRQAVAAIAKLPGPGSVELLGLDLADTESIRAAATALRDLTDGLDAVINNAGVMQTPQQKTADGFEMQFGTNHLGHFLLDHLVFDLVVARGGRVVPVSSIVHHQAKGIDFDDPMLTDRYSPDRAYSQSKLANLLFATELSRRLGAAASAPERRGAGHAVICASAHPGYSATNLQSTGPTGARKFLYRFTNLLAQSAEAGAVPEVLAAAGNEAANGGYYGPTGIGGARGPVGTAKISAAAQDPAAATRLWALSEELLDITWTI
jgi:NAD(P)-dependent dehydrogenase (short-subunit alcohol dehydrogenase family)